MEYIFFHQRTTGISIHVFQLSVQLVYSKFLSWFFEEACQGSLLGWFVLRLCIWLLVSFLCWRRSFFVHWRIISYLNIIITCISRVAFPDFFSNYKKNDNDKDYFICSSYDSLIVTGCYESQHKETDKEANERTDGRADGLVDGWTGRQTDGGTGRQTQTDGRTDGQTNRPAGK